MSRCKLRTPWPIHFKLRIVIGIDSLMVCILFGEISIFHSRVMGLYSSNCRRFFVCRSVNWEPLGQFTSNFAHLLELIVLRSIYILVKFRFFIQELWERKSLQILYECWRRAYHALLAQLFIYYTAEYIFKFINLWKENYLLPFTRLQIKYNFCIHIEHTVKGISKHRYLHIFSYIHWKLCTTGYAWRLTLLCSWTIT
jgi:hypothetical protein